MSKQIVLTHPAHGVFVLDEDRINKLTLAVRDVGDASLGYVRRHTAAACGHDESVWDTALNDCTLIDCLIMWIESGNHPW